MIGRTTWFIQAYGSKCLMVGATVVFGVIASPTLVSGGPVNFELPLSCPTLEPIGAHHANCFAPLLFGGPIGGVISSAIACSHSVAGCGDPSPVGVTLIGATNCAPAMAVAATMGAWWEQTKLG